MTCLRIRDQGHNVHIARAGDCPTLILKSDGKAIYHTPRGIGLAPAATKQFERTLA
ncbi:MAG: hypothetical protein J4G05_11160 [Chlorobi bacterium]|nr:hypothetical protein [Chlorobiota bacterium]